MKLLAVIVSGFTILLAAGLSQTSTSDAHHAKFLEQFTFLKFMDASQVVGNNPPGAIRAVGVCTDGLNGNSGAKTQFRNAVGDWNLAAGFQAFWLFGSGEFFGSCNGTQQVQASWTTNMSPCEPGDTGCAAPTGSDAAGGFTSALIKINSGEIYTSLGLKAVMTHELGHLFGLWEQYVHANFHCNPDPNVVSVMESATRDSFGRIASVCGSTQTQPFDYTAVQNAFNVSFGNPPVPQILWVRPLNTASLRVTFKVPGVAAKSIERTLCGGGFPAAQSKTVINNDVAYADFAMPPSGTSICNQFRVVGGGGGSGVHHGVLNTSKGNISGGWATTYSQSTQHAFMFNRSTTQNVPYTRITNNTNFGNYPECALDESLPALAVRTCHQESFGIGTVYWWSQNKVNYDAMNVP